MEKNVKSRDIRQILISIFPKINIVLLDQILNRESIYTPNRHDSSDSVLNTEDNLAFKDFDGNNTAYSTFSNLSISKQNLNLEEKIKKKEDKYLRVVRKSVTTLNLPTMSNLSKHILPDFLKKTFKSIAARFGANDTSMNKIKIAAFTKLDTIFVMNTAGSQDTDYAFDLVSKRLANISDNHKCIFAFITPTVEEDKTNNYRNKKDIVITSFQNNMRNLDHDRFFFYNEEKNVKGGLNSVQQIEALCEKYQVHYMISGYNALKGPKGDNKVLEKALSVLLKNTRTPFILVKESLFLKPESLLEGFSWLFVFDRVNSKCFNCYKRFSPLIDFNKDKIFAYTLLPSTNQKDDVEPLFLKEMQIKNFNNYNYEMQKYDNDSYVNVNTKVNFGTTHFDFVIIYNNITFGDFNQIVLEKQLFSNTQIILGCSSNICVLNGN